MECAYSLTLVGCGLCRMGPLSRPAISAIPIPIPIPIPTSPSQLAKSAYSAQSAQSLKSTPSLDDEQEVGRSRRARLDSVGTE
jgi:hypothetical protein